MKDKQAGSRRRRRAFPLTIIGFLAGLGAAFVMVRWQRKNMPWTMLDDDADRPSIYEVGREGTAEPAAEVMMEPPAHLVDLDSTFDGLRTADTGLEY